MSRYIYIYMRDYRFRGKRIDTGEWVYGDLYQPDPETDQSPCIIVNELVEIKPSDVNGPAEADQEPRFYEVDPATVGQLTGIGNLYDGDIFADDVDGLWMVYWSDGEWKARY